MAFSKPEYWSGLPFPLPQDLPDPGIKLVSPVLGGGFFTTEPPEKPLHPLLISYYLGTKEQFIFP